MSWNVRDIRHISLKWKLLIPFLFLSLTLTALLTTWSIRSQNRIFLEQEEKRLRQDYLEFQQRLQLKLDVSLAMAGVVASDPVTQRALAEGDREVLIEKYLPVYQHLSRVVGLKQFHFHQYPAKSFLRLHRQEQFGDDLAGYRATILEAYETGRLVGGLELGATGFGIRGVAPIYHQGRLVGSVEVGASIEEPFLQEIKADLGYQTILYLPADDRPQGVKLLASTTDQTFLAGELYQQVLRQDRSLFLTITRDEKNLAVLVGPIKDYQGRTAMLVEIIRDRGGIIFLIHKYTSLIILFGFSILVLAMLFVWLVSKLFLAPVYTLIHQAERIAAGARVPQMEVMVRDEFGALAEALNKMLAALERSRHRLEDHAHELELKVQERTTELVRSEEKFRTLVENIPVVVYRLERDLTRTFVSPYIEKLIGRPSEEMVGGPEVWTQTIHSEDRGQVLAEKERCLRENRPFSMEYRLVAQDGGEVPILDRAIPISEEKGRSIHLEGYMLDIRERKRLEDQTLQAEELKTLAEISARLAHEFRNPLSAVGVCARRMAKNLSQSDPGSPYCNILIEEVARLEKILKMILGYIQPLALNQIEVDSREFFDNFVQAIAPFLEYKNIQIEANLEGDLPKVKIDPDHLKRALVTLIRNAAYQMPSRGTLFLSLSVTGGAVELKLFYPAGYLSDDQLRHFFYPFTTEDADTSLVDLPLVPVIIHKHNGRINVVREGEDLVAVIIELPAA